MNSRHQGDTGQKTPPDAPVVHMFEGGKTSFGLRSGKPVMDHSSGKHLHTSPSLIKKTHQKPHLAWKLHDNRSQARTECCRWPWYVSSSGFTPGPSVRCVFFFFFWFCFCFDLPDSLFLITSHLTAISNYEIIKQEAETFPRGLISQLRFSVSPPVVSCWLRKDI